MRVVGRCPAEQAAEQAAEQTRSQHLAFARQHSATAGVITRTLRQQALARIWGHWGVASGEGEKEERRTGMFTGLGDEHVATPQAQRRRSQARDTGDARGALVGRVVQCRPLPRQVHHVLAGGGGAALFEDGAAVRDPLPARLVRVMVRV